MTILAQQSLSAAPYPPSMPPVAAQIRLFVRRRPSPAPRRCSPWLGVGRLRRQTLPFVPSREPTGDEEYSYVPRILPSRTALSAPDEIRLRKPSPARDRVLRIAQH